MEGTASESKAQEREFLARAKAAEHIYPEMSLHSAPKDLPACNHYWRCIICVDDSDVEECMHCGKQQVVPCRFDDDYA